MKTYASSASNPKTGVQYHIVHGFDPPLGTYFVHLEREVDQKEWNEFEGWTQEEIEAYFDALPEEIIFAVDSNFTLTPHPKYPRKMTWNDGEIIGLIAGVTGVKLEHLQAIENGVPY
jgi:hypothetical protein